MPCFASALVLLLCALTAHGAPAPGGPEQPREAAPKPRATPAQIAQAIRDLASIRFAVREQASKFLWEAGADAEAAVRQAVKNPDAEVARRAQAILDKFEWGIYPDTPRNVVEQIEAYERGDQQTRERAVANLMDARPIPFKALRRIIAREQNPQLRSTLFEQVAEKARAEVPDLLVAGQHAFAAELLETCVAGSATDSGADYAAFMFLSGQLDAAIARWEKTRAAKGPDEQRAADVLVYLYRVKGDWAGARKAARATKNPELEQDLLWQQGAWGELAGNVHPLDRGGNTLGVELALYRLSGQKAKFETAVAEAIKQADAPEADAEQIRQTAEALLLNGRTDEGTQLLVDKKTGLGMAFDLLCARMRYKDAFRLIDDARGRDTDASQRLGVELHRARTLYLLGERETARQLFAKAAEDFVEAPDAGRARTMVRSLSRLGLRDVAYDQAAVALAALAKGGQHDYYAQILEPLFDSQSDAADVLWRVLRQHLPKETPQQVMQRLRDLLTGKTADAARAEVIRWLEADRTLTQDGDNRAVHPGAVAGTIAEICRAAKADEQAEKYYRKATETHGADARVRLGDFLFSRKRYADAAAEYHKAWQANKSQSLGLYLEARALRAAGREGDARRLAELAHWVPLANESVRTTLIEELTKRDMPDAAAREAEMIVRTGWYREPLVGNALAYLARAATRSKHYAQAADYYERALLGCLRTGASFAEAAGYVAVPEAVRVNRALALLSQRKVDEALKLADADLEVMPGNVELVIPLVPELERLGRKKEADDLYRRVRAVYEQLCKDYPDSAFLRNSAAWLMANCRRDLPEAQKHAERAVALEPKAAGYLDTLAEVHFRKGEREKAIELMKKCVSLDGKNNYYRRQLDRFQNKGPDSPTPDETEEEE